MVCSWSRPGPGSRTDPSSSTAPAREEEKPRKRRRAFCLGRMKSRSSSSFGGRQQQREPAANNNNTPFIIHCQIGKEIKHICSNCRGAEPLDGEPSAGGSAPTFVHSFSSLSQSVNFEIYWKSCRFFFHVQFCFPPLKAEAVDHHPSSDRRTSWLS